MRVLFLPKSLVLKSDSYQKLEISHLLIKYINPSLTFQPNLRVFERGECLYKGLFSETLTYESNMPYTLRFMIDTKVSPFHGSKRYTIPKYPCRSLE